MNTPAPTDTQQSSPNSLFLLLTIVLWVSIVGICVWMSQGNWRTSLVLGAELGGLSGVLGLAMMSVSSTGSVQQFMQAGGLAAMLRVFMVGGGIVVCMKMMDNKPIEFTASFFVMFFALKIVEFFVVTTAQNEKKRLAQQPPQEK